MKNLGINYNNITYSFFNSHFSNKFNKIPEKKINIPNAKNEGGGDILFCKIIKKFKIIDDNNNANTNNKLILNNNGINRGNGGTSTLNLQNGIRINRGRFKNKDEVKLPNEESLDDEKIVNRSFLEIEEKKTSNNQLHFEGDLRKKISKSTNKYDKTTKKQNMMFYNTGLAFNKVKLNCKDVKIKPENNNKIIEKQQDYIPYK